MEPYGVPVDSLGFLRLFQRAFDPVRAVELTEHLSAAWRRRVSRPAEPAPKRKYDRLAGHAVILTGNAQEVHGKLRLDHCRAAIQLPAVNPPQGRHRDPENARDIYLRNHYSGLRLDGAAVDIAGLMCWAAEFFSWRKKKTARSAHAAPCAHALSTFDRPLRLELLPNR
jgi:hypothetical protein